MNREFVALSNRYMQSRATGSDEYQALMDIFNSNREYMTTTLSDLDAAFRDALASKD
jgi:hypothetical protein